MADDSLSLLQRLSDGDSGALETLLQRHLPAVRAYVRVNAGQAVRAKEGSVDIVQSVCREMLQNLDRFQYPGEGAFRQWLFATALRKVRNRHRYYRAGKRDMGAEVPYEERAAAELRGGYGTIATPSQELVAREEIERIEAAMDRLPPEYREVLLQFHVMGLKRSEVAAALGKSEDSVRALLMRARARLARFLGADDSE